MKIGARTPLFVDQDRYAFLRDSGDGQPVIVLLSKSKSKSDVPLAGNLVPRGVYQDIVTNQQVELAQGDSVSVSVEPLSVRVLVRADSPCR
jgi:hypothetical protein